MGGWSANLTLPDYGRVARHSGAKAKVSGGTASAGCLLRGDLTLCEKYAPFYRRANPSNYSGAVATRNADQTLDKRFNSSAQPSTTTICLDVAASWSSSLIIRKRLPSAVTSKLEEVAPGAPHELLIPCE